MDKQSVWLTIIGGGWLLGAIWLGQTNNGYPTPYWGMWSSFESFTSYWSSMWIYFILGFGGFILLRVFVERNYRNKLRRHGFLRQGLIVRLCQKISQFTHKFSQYDCVLFLVDVLSSMFKLLYQVSHPISKTQHKPNTPHYPLVFFRMFNISVSVFTLVNNTGNNTCLIDRHV